MLRNRTLISDDTMYYVKYARVSSDEQREGISIDLQLKRIDEWIARQSGEWVCIGVFIEDFTGFEYERPEMNIIWELAKEGRINAIVVLRRNRFSRGEAASIILEQHFKKNNVRLFSVEKGEFTPGKTNRIVSAVERAQSEEEAESAKENMREKRYAYVDAGAAPSAGPARYGYNKIGKKASTRYEINEDEAETIRYIYDLYIKRWSFDQIADDLNQQEIPQPSRRMSRDGAKERGNRHIKRGWTKGIVAHLIRNAEQYHGVMTAYKYAVREDAPEQRAINIPAIIDDATYTKVMYLLEQSRHAFFNKQKDSRIYPYIGRLSCKCGYSYSSSSVQRISKRTKEIYGYSYYYRCNSTMNRKYRGGCDVKSVNAEKLEAVLWDFIKGILIDPRTAIARYKQQQNDIQRVLDTAIAHIESIDEVLAELNAEKEQLIKLFKKRLIDEDRLDADMLVINRQHDKLDHERAKWTLIIEQNSVSESQIQQLESISAMLRNELEDLDLDRRLAVLDKLRIKVTAAREKGCIILYVSILGATPERLELVDSCDDVIVEHLHATITLSHALIFRIPVA